MELLSNTLTQMMSEAYDSGYFGGSELRDEVVVDILEKYKMFECDDKPPIIKNKDDDYRVYTLAELRQLPVGAVLMHSTLGRCVVNKKHGDKYVAFDNVGLSPAGFNVDTYPWNLGIKRI